MESKVVPGRAVPLGAYPHWKRVGDFIYISGTSSRRPDGSIAGATEDGQGGYILDIGVQTTELLGNIRVILESAGAGLEDLADLTTFLVNMEDFPKYNKAYGEVFRNFGPTRTTVAVRELPNPLLLIEMKAVAYVGDRE
jgi:2-aminomuconate deaminase